MAAATRSARLLVAPVNESGALRNRCGRAPLSLNLASPPKVDKRIISGAGVRVIDTGGGLGCGRVQGRGGLRWWMRPRDAGGGGAAGGGDAGGGGGAAELGRMPDAGRRRVGDAGRR